MEWSDNVSLSFLEKKNWNSLEEFRNHPRASLLLTVTDQTMYDRYEKGDTIRILVSPETPEDTECLIYNKHNDTVSLRKVTKDDSKYYVSQTFPEQTQEYDLDEIEVLGYATSIMRV